MFQDGWSLYEAPYPKRWMFRPRRRPVMVPVFKFVASLLLAFALVEFVRF
ncbi:MAG TPA: hypothetical protein VHC40_02975 [Rhizomicrobium sp.]|jgi:hypothetical protein|nr:hypothetical protein [Rhizomicrobium sp.]